MKNKAIMLVPTTNGVGLNAAVLGIFEALHQRNTQVHFFKPIQQQSGHKTNTDSSHPIMSMFCNNPIIEPITASEAEHLIAMDEMDRLLEKVVAHFSKNAPNEEHIIIIEGLAEHYSQDYARNLNQAIANALDVDIVLVSAPYDKDIIDFEDHLRISIAAYGADRVTGIIATNLEAPLDENNRIPLIGGVAEGITQSIGEKQLENCQIFKEIPLIGAVKYDASLVRPRSLDLCRQLHADIINKGDMNTRRISEVVIVARNIENIAKVIKPGILIITPADRTDVIMLTALHASNGLKIGGLLLTGIEYINDNFTSLWKAAFKQAKLPVFGTKNRSTWEVARLLTNMNKFKPDDDEIRFKKTSEYYAGCLSEKWLQNYESEVKTHHLTPPAFKYQLIGQARKELKKIVLPEGDDLRTIEAAATVARKKIAHCYLLGKPKEIKRIAKQSGIDLKMDGLDILNADDLRPQYIDRLIERRKHKGMTPTLAKELIQDNVVLGTMMLAADEMDGLVSGAVHTTANTIRPPLQILKTAPNASLVSSVFFMCLPNQVLVYGDCAINPDPTAEQLADIAIQSSDSAKKFGIDPKVAMISYSTGTSGSGADVEKVAKATQLVKEKRPDIVVDGPLQYDAAIMEEVAQSKAPDSLVAGKATVFIFPNLNTGNTTYKAVQRSTNCVSIGPMLQGMNKPVNDLSRGALVEDIIYTIVLTCIQAQGS